jgi:hypothetical protein
MASEIVMFVRAERNEMALLRIGDLMNHNGYLSGRWGDRLPKKSKDSLFRAQGLLRSMHQLLGAAGDPGPDDKARLARSCQEVSEILSLEQGLATKAGGVGNG